ncbi:TPA_asm: hypothetical protein vir520_00051 [Caudoviricetes sp. vir520]|nr:TPA_asm: hypothetical protein vir520_00051 [Caudoviricetes sp. vir520]
MNPDDYKKGAIITILAKSHKGKRGFLAGRYGDKLSVILTDTKNIHPSHLVFDAADIELTER